MKINLETVLAFLVIIPLLGCNPVTKPPEKTEKSVILAFENQKAILQSSSGQTSTELKGEIVLTVDDIYHIRQVSINSIRMTGSSVNTESGESGLLSLSFPKSGWKSMYDSANNELQCEFISELHYPLIDKKLGYKPIDKEEEEQDIYESYIEKFKGSLTIRFADIPEKESSDSTRIIPDGAKIDFKMELVESELGEIVQLESVFQTDLVIIQYIHILSTLKVQPVFIRFNPDHPCCCGGTTATTGGAYETNKAYAIEIWDRCCIRLDFLNPVFIDDDDYRILADAEETDLMDEYDDEDAVEVFFVADFDPVGNHGGGVCYGLGTANTKIITCDSNLPINLYNLAHELGHALGLTHPGGYGSNSTAGSVMEPSGFCLDNPSLQSDENCDNADNPILSTGLWLYKFCIRDTNMP